MATINKNRIRPSRQKNICSEAFNSAPFYNSLAWKRFRNTYIKEHPICECCLKHKHIEPATELHHKTPYSNGITEEDQWRLFLDPKNIISLCERCHYAIHTKIKEYKLTMCDDLTEKEYKEAHE